METLVWTDCYDGNWKGFITDASHCHPAKFSKALIERIFDHLMKRGSLQRGGVVGDCFGGVCTGGLVAAYRGLHWVGVELEPRFVKLAQENVALHESRLKSLGCPLPVILQGDSRKFHELVGPSVDAIVTSPPYADSVNCSKSGIDWTKAKRPERWIHGPNRHAVQASADHVMKYGETDGQVGALKSGEIDAVVTSPPFLATAGGCKPRMGGTIDHAMMERHNATANDRYGTSPEQVGNLKSETNGSNETYWSACFKIYLSCRLALRPGGIIALVVKDYCQGGKRVRLCDDTARLLEHCGFTMIERVQAMLVSEKHEHDLFSGPQVKRKERKSFFRRLYEAKVPAGDERRIDYEEVLIAQAL